MVHGLSCCEGLFHVFSKFIRFVLSVLWFRKWWKRNPYFHDISLKKTATVQIGKIQDWIIIKRHTWACDVYKDITSWDWSPICFDPTSPLNILPFVIWYIRWYLILFSSSRFNLIEGIFSFNNPIFRWSTPKFGFGVLNSI